MKNIFVATFLLASFLALPAEAQTTSTRTQTTTTKKTTRKKTTAPAKKVEEPSPEAREESAYEAGTRTENESAKKPEGAAESTTDTATESPGRVEEATSPRDYEAIRNRRQKDEPEVVEPPTEEPTVSSTPRGSRFITAGYTGAIFGLAIPTKHGPSVTWIANDRWSIEANYFTGSIGLSLPFIDLGGLSETVISVNGRMYVGNSFNLIAGLSHQTYEARLGNDLLSRIPSAPGAIDLLSSQTLGLQLGLGNRWQLENGFMFGVDWLVVNFPFATLQSNSAALDYITNADDRRRVEDAMKFMRYFPTGAVTKVAIGYSF